MLGWILVLIALSILLFRPRSSRRNEGQTTTSPTELSSDPLADGLPVITSSVSPNGDYELVWRDGDPSRMIFGFRTKGHGAYALLRKGQLVVRGALERPNDGMVADNGTFAINDWLFGEGLKGVFYVFTPSGEVLISKRTDANLLNNGISSDGRYAVCQTAHAPTDEGNTLFFFDVQSRQCLWAHAPEVGWAKSYEFDPDHKVLYLVLEGGHKYAYDFTGRFIDQARFEREKPLRAKSGYDFYDLAKERFDRIKEMPVTEPISENLTEIATFARKSVEIGNMTQRFSALPHRLLGEIYLKQGHISEAISEFDLALGFDPNCGCKRLLAQARKLDDRQRLDR